MTSLVASVASPPSPRGVAGVLSIRYRRRGFVPNYVELPGELPLAIDEILRIDNDPNHPERGAVAVNVCGGK